MKDMLKGKIAWVTGASSGMGEATALTFGREGATVVVGGGRNVKAAEELVRQIEAEGGRPAITGLWTFPTTQTSGTMWQKSWTNSEG
jgi:NAD(P)-dependent dehydrogenase (short-subunit alcohol dehydrogenase family)